MIGKIVSNYRILEKIGEGGMGIVYKAEDVKLERIVALKFLPSHLTKNEMDKARFMQEARAAAALNHPNVCTIHEIHDEGENPFIVMEYVEGRTLRELITGVGAKHSSDNIKKKEMNHTGNASPLQIHDIIDIAIQIAGALKNAHAKGIVHRDIKSENIMVIEDGRVKVMDFGLARMRGSAKLTKTGTTTGTTAYMSPEQFEGKKIDHRIDIWSYGIILYEMLTGRLPFKGEYESAMMYSIINEAPEPVTDVRSETPYEIHAIVDQCLKKNPDERYQNMDDVLADLGKAKNKIGDEGISTRRFEKKSSPSIAVLPFVNMSADPEQEYFCDGMAEEIINALTHVENLHVVSRTSAFAFKGKHVNIRDIARELNVENILEGSVRKAGNRLRITAQLIKVADDYHLWSEKYDRNIEDIFDIQDEISLAVVYNLKVKLFGEEKVFIEKRQTDDYQAYNLYLKGIYFLRQFTAKGFEKAPGYFEQALQIDPNYARAYYGLSALCFAQSFWGNVPPKQAYPQAREYVKKALEIDNTLGEAHAALGFIYMYYDWNWEEAERELKHALQLNPNNVSIHAYYSWLLTFTGRHQEAVSEMRSARKLDPLSSFTNTHLGLALCWAGLIEESIEELKKTIEMNPDYFLSHDSLGQAYLANSMINEAIVEFEKGVKLSKGIPITVAHVAEACYLSGDDKRGEELFNSLKERSKQEYVPPICFFAIQLARRDMEQVYYFLERAYEEHDGFLPWVFELPHIDFKTRVLPDPRFKAFLKKLGLP